MTTRRMKHRAKAQTSDRCEEEHHKARDVMPRDGGVRAHGLAEGDDQQTSEEDRAP